MKIKNTLRTLTYVIFCSLVVVPCLAAVVLEPGPTTIYTMVEGRELVQYAGWHFEGWSTSTWIGLLSTIPIGADCATLKSLPIWADRSSLGLFWAKSDKDSSKKTSIRITSLRNKLSGGIKDCLSDMKAVLIASLMAYFGRAFRKFRKPKSDSFNKNDVIHHHE